MQIAKCKMQKSKFFLLLVFFVDILYFFPPRADKLQIYFPSFTVIIALPEIPLCGKGFLALSSILKFPICNLSAKGGSAYGGQFAIRHSQNGIRRMPTDDT